MVRRRDNGDGEGETVSKVAFTAKYLQICSSDAQLLEELNPSSDDRTTSEYRNKIFYFFFF